MNLIIKINQFQIYYLLFMNAKNNMVIDGKFTKLIYSNNYIILNGLYIDMEISVEDGNTEQIQQNNRWQQQQHSENHHSKFLFYFDPNKNSKMISEFSQLEKEILDKFSEYNHQKKDHVYSLKNQLYNGCVKYYREHMIPINSLKKYRKGYYLKISGIWENTKEIGITYKIIEYITETA